MITSVTVGDEGKFSVGNSGTNDGRLNPGGPEDSTQDPCGRIGLRVERRIVSTNFFR